MPREKTMKIETTRRQFFPAGDGEMLADRLVTSTTGTEFLVGA
jgi:hypothetical protein